MDIDKFNSGCIKQKEDLRDRLYKPKYVHWTQLDNIDLRANCPNVRDQLHIGSCTAFASTSLFNFVRKKNNLTNWVPSPLFTYYATRLADKTETEDSGASVRDALKSTVRDGVAMERVWPYIVDRFTERPPDVVWEDAEKHQTLEYLKLDDFDKNVYLNCLNDGYPFVFGLNLYSSFFDPIFTMLGGFMQDPDRDNEKLIGGHCMMAVGYIKNYNDKEYLIVQNSWGNGWGDKGYCYIPLSYIMSNDSFDFWTIRLTEVCNEDIADPIPEPPKPEPVPEPPKPEPVPESPKTSNSIILSVIIGASIIVMAVWMFFY
jgi:C1A family cysteine protease